MRVSLSAFRIRFFSSVIVGVREDPSASSSEERWECYDGTLAGRLEGPGAERVAVLEDVGRDLEVGLGGHPRIRLERLHAPIEVLLAAERTRPEVEPALEEDPEEAIVPVEAVAAEHRPDLHAVPELLRDEVPEGVLLLHRWKTRIIDPSAQRTRPRM